LWVKNIWLNYLTNMKKIIKFSLLNVLLILQMMLSQGCGKNDSNSDSKSKNKTPYKDEVNQPQVPLEVYIDGVSTSDRITKIRNENKSLIYGALEKLEEGQRIEVVEDVESQCNGTPAKYVISKDKEELNLILDVKFTPAIGTRHDDFLSGVEQVKSCIPEIENFYQRYDTQFKLNIYTDEPSKDIKTLNRVEITTKNVRSNSGLYSMKDPDFCRMVLHEMGHLFGLSDEYYELGSCRTNDHSSKDIYPWSLMDKHMSEIELFPRHFKTILGAAHDEVNTESNVSQEKEPKRLILTLVKDLIPDKKGPGWAELNLISKSSDFTGKLIIVARSKEALINIVPAGTRLVFKNTKGISIDRRVRTRDGSLDTRRRYLINFNDGIKTQDDIYLNSFGTDFLTNDSKIRGLERVLNEFGKLEQK
jgi:hypothetical protein